MKKIIYILASAAMAAACVSTIEMDVRRPESRLILNSQLHSEDNMHVVSLCSRTDRINTSDGIEHISEADVICYINGEAAAVASEVRNESSNYFGDSYYVFQADFKPGDELRLEANKNVFFAYSEMKVPEAVPVELVDTATVMI